MSHETRSHTVAGFVTGALAAAIAMFILQALTAEAVGSDESTFVPTTPCRLFDTRPNTNIGPKSSPLGPGEEYRLQVTGAEGNCVLPSTATGVAINLTAVQATAPTFVAIYPADMANPGTSVLNLVPGQTATPNKVDVKLSSDGAVKISNANGSIHLIGDVLGYYQHDGLADLEGRVVALEASSGTDPSVLNRLGDLEADRAALQADVAALQADVAALEVSNALLEADMAALQTLTASMSLETVDDQPTVRFTGVNVQVVDGQEDAYTGGPVNGLGNLIIGYNENYRDVPGEGPGNDRTGSHNLVIGRYHDYSSWSGLVAGDSNTVEGYGASVTGGAGNTAGERASVTGGIANSASGDGASVTGGVRNTASGDVSSLTGGSDSTASGTSATVTGGSDNTASGDHSTVTGGFANTAAGRSETTLGGSNVPCDDGDDFDAIVCGEGTLLPPGTP